MRDGDAVLVQDGYHPVVAGHGYNVYYLNCLAGSTRLLLTTEDPDHVWVRSTWNQVDPRLPLVRGTRRLSGIGEINRNHEGQKLEDAA